MFFQQHEETYSTPIPGNIQLKKFSRPAFLPKCCPIKPKYVDPSTPKSF
jgi:hypothetical protein